LEIYEGQLEGIEAGKDSYASVIEYAVNSLVASLIIFRTNGSDIGLRISNAAKLLHNIRLLLRCTADMMLSDLRYVGDLDYQYYPIHFRTTVEINSSYPE
jgi:hypothetical protein